MLLAAWAIDTSGASGKVPRNVKLAGRDIGRMPEDQLAATVRDVATQYAKVEVQVHTPGRNYQLTGADLGNILGHSGHKLFVDGPDLHAEVEPVELQQLAFVTHQQITQAQEDAQHNQRLEDALASFRETENRENAEAVVQAFLRGHCRYPVAGEADTDAEALVISQEAQEGRPAVPEIALLTQEGALPAFTSEAALQAWNTTPRNAVLLDGPTIAQLASQAEIEQVLLNPGSPETRTLNVKQGQISLS